MIRNIQNIEMARHDAIAICVSKVLHSPVASSDGYLVYGCQVNIHFINEKQE